MDMTIELRTEAGVGDGQASVRSVLKSLRNDSELRLRTAELTPASADPEDMGLGQEILHLVLAPQLTAALAGALATWLTTRSRHVKLHVKKGDDELTVEADRAKDADKLINEIRGFLAEEVE